MADNHGAAMADDPMDMAAHEATYAGFVALTETVVFVLIGIVLLLVLWGLEGHGFVALIGFILTVIAATIGSLTGMGWRAIAPVVALLGLACIVL